MTVGQAVRARRLRARLRLVDLAAKIDVSPSYLSQIERDRVAPSVLALGRIADGLNVSLVDLFQSVEDKRSGTPVVRHDQRTILILPGSTVQNELLTPNLKGQLEVMWSKIPPGTVSPVLQHEGQECGVVLRGELVFWLGERRWVLAAGDAITFESAAPHRYENPSKEVVETIWIVTPPSL